MDPRTPVIVGVGQFTNRRERIVGPLDLMEEASRRAAADTGIADAAARIRSVQVVNVLNHSFPAPASALADRLGVPAGERLQTAVGGNTPQWLLARTCDRIVSGEIDSALLVGAEALDSIRQAMAKGLPVDRGDRNAPPGDELIGDTRNASGPAEMSARLMAPPTIYPMFENALAARAGRSMDEQRMWLGRLMAPFTTVAASHPDTAWFPVERTPEELSTVRPDNRYVGEPYPKLLNAIMQVDQGAATIVMSAEAAEAAGVPRDRWVFPWASAECNDVFITSQRPDLTRSPAIEAAGRRAFEAAGISVDDVRWIDLYSCFPCAVQIGAQSLGIALDDPRGLTVTGGLPYFGGAGNNYVSHSIAITVDRCRQAPDGIGLVTGLGWYVTKHAVGLYSATPPPNGYRHGDCSQDQAEIDAQAVEVTMDAEGVAVVEGFTVQHDRERGPVHAPVFGRLDDGRRVVASPADQSLPAELSGRNLVGQKVQVRAGDRGLVYEPI